MTASSRRASEQTMKTVFHADLTFSYPGEEQWLKANGRKYKLLPHTDETRAKARAINPELGKIPDRQMTHYTDAVDLPANQAIRVHIKSSLKTFPGALAKDAMLLSAMHVPPVGEAAERLTQAGGVAQAPLTPLTTLQSLVFHHADLINVDADVTNRIYTIMNGEGVLDLMAPAVQLMNEMGPPAIPTSSGAPDHEGWAVNVPFTPPVNPETGFDGQTYFMQQPVQGICDSLGPAMTAVQKATKNDVALAGKKWTVQTGLSVTPPPSAPPSLQAVASIDTVQGDSWSAGLANTDEVHGLTTSIAVADAGLQQVTITMNNLYIRYLSAYIQFLDINGIPIPQPDNNWYISPSVSYAIAMAAMGDVIQPASDAGDGVYYLGVIQPVDNIIAIPINSDPGVLTVTVQFPPNAVSAVLYGAGIGTGSNPYSYTPVMGGVLTGVLNLGLPAFMLATGAAAQSYKPLYQIVKSLSEDEDFVKGVILAGVAYFGAQFVSSAVNKQMNWRALISLAGILFNQAATKVLVWVETTMAEEDIADEIPFAGWILLALNIATGLAQIAETIVEVATSPWDIENTISTTITSTVTVQPDPRQHGAFPAGITPSCTVKMIYQNQNRPTVTQQITQITPPSFQALFANNTLGGNVKFEADFYVFDGSGNQFLAGKATTGWLANDSASAADITLVLVEFPIPLTSATVYSHQGILTYQNSAYAWQTAGSPPPPPSPLAPTATVANTNTSSTGNAISMWTGLTLSQRDAMLGFAWTAAGMGIGSCVSGAGNVQLSAMEALGIPGLSSTPTAFPSCGFDSNTRFVFDAYAPKFLMKGGQWVLNNGQPEPDPSDISLGNYYVDPRKASNDPTMDGGYHLRSVSFASPVSFNMAATQPSFGRMSYQPDSLVLHPSGHFVAVNQQYCKIQIGMLTAGGDLDANVPMARVYSGEAGVADRPGLIFHPVGVACSNDGTILVLEDTKSSTGPNPVILARVQAFDLRGRPVSRFLDGSGNPTPFLELSTTGMNTYLDITAVGDHKLTYIFVLYYTGDGSAPTDYNISVYQYGTQAPDANPLFTNNGVSAARIMVDMWHTLYTLNYAMTTDGKGNNAGPAGANPAWTGPAGVTVPSVSQWIP